MPTECEKKKILTATLSSLSFQTSDSAKLTIVQRGDLDSLLPDNTTKPRDSPSILATTRRPNLLEFLQVSARGATHLSFCNPYQKTRLARIDDIKSEKKEKYAIIANKQKVKKREIENGKGEKQNEFSFELV